MANIRPKRVTIVAWLSIIFSFISATPKFLLVFNQEVYQQSKEFVEKASENGLLDVPFELQMVHALLGSMILITSSLFILKGKLWAVYLYTFWIYGVVVLTLLITGTSPQFISKAIVACLLCGFLFSPKAMQFFRGSNEQDE